MIIRWYRGSVSSDGPPRSLRLRHHWSEEYAGHLMTIIINSRHHCNHWNQRHLQHHLYHPHRRHHCHPQNHRHAHDQVTKQLVPLYIGLTVLAIGICFGFNCGFVESLDFSWVVSVFDLLLFWLQLRVRRILRFSLSCFCFWFASVLASTATFSNP